MMTVVILTPIISVPGRLTKVECGHHEDNLSKFHTEPSQHLVSINVWQAESLTDIRNRDLSLNRSVQNFLGDNDTAVDLRVSHQLAVGPAREIGFRCNSKLTLGLDPRHDLTVLTDNTSFVRRREGVVQVVVCPFR
jgi:hypothetical protein